MFAQQAVFACLVYSNFQAFDGQWILRPDVDQSFGCTYAVSADSHSFENGVRVALEDRTIHKCTRVAFIGIAHHVFLVCIILAGDLPFNSGRETGATAPAQPRSFNDIDGFLRVKLRQSHPQRLVSIPGNGFVYVFGIDSSAIP
ncbi:hypothetical protein SDC9_135416 [bioreactor metagenome]|uniref:Uncharacterized protein n=1 Tax=bioreactor metagenome TaxID=1076179 RepID=A0A645DFS5_9ZZZZ